VLGVRDYQISKQGWFLAPFLPERRTPMGLHLNFFAILNNRLGHDFGDL